MLARVAVVATFVGSLAVVLATRVPDIVDTPLVSDDLGWSLVPVPLEERSRDGGRKTAGLRLRLRSVDALLVHPEIRLQLATYAQRARLIDGTLRIESFRCAYRTPPDARLVDNQYVPFVRDADCRRSSGSGPTDLHLSVTFSGPERVALWTYQPPEGEEPTAPDMVVSVGRGGPMLVVRGRYVDYRNQVSLRRIDLLAYMWQLSEDPTWLWVALAVAAVGLLAGLFLFPMRSREPGAKWGLGAAAGAFCFAAALGTLYAVLVPPFQAPDEPDHFLSYATVAGDDTLPGQAAALARLGHFERMKFHSDEKFRPSDVGHPYAEAWASHVVAEDVMARSPTTGILFSWLGRVLHGRTPSQVLLATRLVNTWLFALAVASGAWLVGVAGARPYPQLAVVPVLLVPTLPFFGMMMSEFAVLTAGFVLVSYCLVALFLDGTRGHLLGLAVGVSSALVFASGRSAGPLAVTVAGALTARVLLGSRGRMSLTEQVRHAVLFWGGLGTGVVAFSFLATHQYREQLLLTLSRGHVGGSSLLPALLEQPLWLLPLASVAASLEVILRGAIRSIGASRAGRWSTWVAALACGVALAVALGVVASLFVPLPYLDTFESSLPSDAPTYAARVLVVLGTSVRLGNPDHLLVASFWSGFGWIDTLPPSFLTTALVLLSALSGVLLLLHLARTRDMRRIVWLIVMAVAWVGTVSAYAVVSYATGRNLHGRYLIGFYVSLLTVVWSAPVLLPELQVRDWRLARWLSIPRSAVLLATCAAVHAYCLQFILTRYF